MRFVLDGLGLEMRLKFAKKERKLGTGSLSYTCGL